MYEVYLQAFRGDLDAIKQWLLSNLDKIDEPWDGHTNLPISALQVFEVLGTYGLIGAAFVVNPLFGLGAAGVAAKAFCYNGHYVYKSVTREGWTLLQFAAEGGAVEVARFLVENGASRKGKNNIDFLDIALKNDQKLFIEEWKKIEREWALEIKAKNTATENQSLRTQLTQQTTYIKKLQGMVSKQTDGLTSLKSASKISGDAQKLKDEIINLNRQIQAYQDYKNKSQDIILQLVHKYERLVQKYKEKVGSSPPASPKAPKKENNSLQVEYAILLKKYNQHCTEFTEFCKKSSDDPNFDSKKEVMEKAIHEEYQELCRIYNTLYAVNPQSQKPETKKSPIAEDAYEYGMKAKKYDFIIGDCFIDSVITNQGNRKWTKRELREAISKELKDNRTKYEWTKDVWEGEINPYAFSYENYEEYCDVIAKDTCSLADLEIQAFVKAKKVCCVLLEMGEPETLIFGSEYYSQSNPPIFIGHYGNPLTETGHYVPLDCPDASLNTVLQKIIEDKNDKTGKPGAAVPGIFSKIPEKVSDNLSAAKGPAFKA